MQVDTRSRLFVVWVAVTGAVVVGMIARARGDEMNAWYAGFMVLAAIGGALLGQTIRSRR
ncbi:MAG: hypothetical protein RIB65_06105 [Ilumatobacter fluminis]|uniref:hypothetical protein n=1 Tax=Ilumatobacter fluminis TaxID=467091 RepID=UPI0032EB95F2